ncbi:MAG: glycerate kinase [Eubacterium sp.]|nr:glycerate kinase [Eubacterium sp.]
MKAVIAIDSLKGSLSSLEAGDAIREGFLLADPDAQVEVRPLADGGEGTVEALTIGMGGTLQKVVVSGPVGQKVEAVYGILQDGTTAVMEMSQAAGITQVTDAERNPLNTTTYGVGQMILDAIKKGCRQFIMGIGGSATNDGGIGMLQALGYGMLDAEGKQVAPGAKGLKDLDHITSDAVAPELSLCSFRIACDVTNPLCGEQGCSAIFGPQKGADPSMIKEMDGWLGSYAEIAKKTFPKADPLTPGTGAAGGLGFAFLTFTNAVLESGIKIVLDETHLEDYIKDADLVVTGEGRLDAQTVMGKGPAGVAAIAKKYGKPVVALAGSIKEDAHVCNDHGIDAFFPILRRICTLEEAMNADNARRNMTETAEQVMRLFLAGRRA